MWTWRAPPSVIQVKQCSSPAGASARARLGERFLRSSGRGSGLGLSIALAIATLHGGGLALAQSPAGGARVLLRLPATNTA